MAPPLLSPEARLLFAATRTDLGAAEDRPAKLRGLIDEGVDWQAVIRLGAREKMLPVFWHGLADVVDRIPVPQADALRGLAAATEFTTATREATLIDALATLESAGCPTILLKGAALGKAIYPSFSLRPMGDLDLLLRKTEVERGWQALRDAGWSLELEEGRADYGGHHHLPPLVDPVRAGSVVELHHALVPPRAPFDLDEDALWSEASSLAVGSATAWVPSSRWLLLHLCLHFGWSNQLRRGLGRAVRDVSTLLQAKPPDDETFVELARSAGATTVCYWTLRLASSLGGAAVSDGLSSALEPSLPGPLLDRLHGVYAAAGVNRAFRSVRVGRMWWSLGIRPRASGHGAIRPWTEGEIFS